MNVLTSALNPELRTQIETNIHGYQKWVTDRKVLIDGVRDRNRVPREIVEEIYLELYPEKSTGEIPEQPKTAEEMQIQASASAPGWETPVHREVDPFDPEYDLIAQTAKPAGPEVTPFMHRASILIERGIPVAPLPPTQKFAPPKEWEKLATTDLTALAAMNPHTDGNTAAVARAELGGFCFFEVDEPNFHNKVEEQTGQKFPKTLLVSSTPGKGRGHFYFKHTPKSIALQTTSSKAYVSGKDQNGKEAWSFRMHNAYVVGPESVKEDGTVYTAIDTSPIAECPDWFIEWISTNSTDTKTGHAELDSEEPIAEGARNTQLTSILGKARQVLKMDKEQLLAYGLSVNEKRCKPPLKESEVKTIANSISSYPVKASGAIVFSDQPQQEIPVIEDPSDTDSRFEMTGEAFDTKVYEDVSSRYTPYPDPGENDLISRLAKKLVTGTPIPLAYVREPLKAAVLHAIDGKVVHPAHRKLTMRGNYFSLGESEGGKTTGLEYAINACNVIFSTNLIHEESLFRYKSEQTFIRSFTPEGTIKRDAQGNIKSGHAGHPSQFLYVKEGNLVANSSDYFAAVFAMLTNLYDQTEAATESMTNGTFDAATIRTSTVMCFTPTDYAATFGGKGNIGGGGLNRWGIVNPQPDHSYDDKDWEPLSDQKIQDAINPLTEKVFNLKQSEPIVLVEEAGAAKIRLEVKSMLKKAGKAGKRLLEYFMREQVAQAVVALDGRMVMTTQQAVYAREWVEAQVMCRLNCWPSDASNQIEGMEHAIRKAVNRHFVSETALKDACHLYREGSGGWYAFNAARSNMVQSEAIKPTGKTRKGVRTYCPGSCAIHPPVKKDVS